jgi:hypothetical protein
VGPAGCLDRGGGLNAGDRDRRVVLQARDLYVGERLDERRIETPRGAP